MAFFPEPPPVPVEEWQQPPQPVWCGPPEDVLPGVVPVELVLGRSASAVVVLTGIRAFPTGLAMTLGVRVRGPVVRGDLNAEVFDGPHRHDAGADWQAGRLKWGFELADGRRATNVDPWVWDEQTDDPAWVPSRPVLHGMGGGGGPRSVEREQWLWPLPPSGTLAVVCQWLDQGVDLTRHELDATPFLDAAARAVPLWPDT